MKQEIHPNYSVVKVTCANCGKEYELGTTATKGFLVGLCSNCHPAYTGKTTIIDSTNRVSRYMERQKKSEEMRNKKVSK